MTAAIAKVAPGGTIALRGGSYHEQVIVPPQKSLTIQPYRKEAVWLDGAEAVSGWRKDGNFWVRDGWTLSLDASPTYKRGAPDYTTKGWNFIDPAYPMAAHPDQLWVGGSALTEVGSRQAVNAKTFFVDDANDRLITGGDPTNKVVEASTLTQALSVRSQGSVVKGIGVRRYATSVPDIGTVVIAAADVTLANVTVRDNSTTGIATWSPRTRLTSVSVIGNGLLGASASQADGLVVTGLLSSKNNSEHFNRAPVSGALKIGRSRDVTITGSIFTDNYGQGPWFDESVYDITFTGNDSLRNTGSGLVLELSDTAVIADNVVASNGINGVYVIDTGNVAIWNNTLVGNQRNLAIVQDSRRASDTSAAGHDPRRPLPDPTVPWITRNVVVSNNVLAAGAGNCVVCVEDYSRSYTGAQMVTQSNGNLYHRINASTPQWFSVFSRGTAAVNPAVQNTLAAFVSTTGRDTRSKLVEGNLPVNSSFALSVAWKNQQSSIAVPVPSSVAAVSALTAGSATLGAQPK